MPYYNKILTCFSVFDSFFHSAAHSRMVSAYGTGGSELAFCCFIFSKVNAIKDATGLLKGGVMSFFVTLEKNERYQSSVFSF